MDKTLLLILCAAERCVTDCSRECQGNLFRDTRGRSFPGDILRSLKEEMRELAMGREGGYSRQRKQCKGPGVGNGIVHSWN